MIPLVSTEAEIKIMKDLVIRVAGKVEKENKIKVDYLVGTMIAVSQKKISINDFKNLLNNPKKDAKIFKAPSKGLVLKEVFYEN